MSDRIVTIAKNHGLKIPGAERVSAFASRIKNYPIEWFQNSLDLAVAERRITESRAAIVRGQINDPKAYMQLMDIFVCGLGIRLALKPFDFAMLGAAAYNEDPLLALVPVAVHTGSRFAYMGLRISHDRFVSNSTFLPSLKRDMVALAAAALPIAGSFAAPLRTQATYPELADFSLKEGNNKIDNALKISKPDNYNLPTVYRPF